MKYYVHLCYSILDLKRIVYLTLGNYFLKSSLIIFTRNIYLLFFSLSPKELKHRIEYKDNKLYGTRGERAVYRVLC